MTWKTTEKGKTGERLGIGELPGITNRGSPPMTMAAHAVAFVDHFADARKEMEEVFRQLTEAGASLHVQIGKLVTEGMARAGARAFQGHLNALFDREQEEVKHWARPDGSKVRARERGLETAVGRMTVRRHGLTLAGETRARFPMD